MSTRDIHGVSNLVRESGLAALLDAPAEEVVRHFQSSRSKTSLCGATDGFTTDDVSGGVTCEGCRAELAKRRAAKAITKAMRTDLRKLSAALKKVV